MAGFRSYYPQGKLVAGQRVELDSAESRHLLKALRAKVGDKVTLFDGLGNHWLGEFATSGNGSRATVVIHEAGKPQSAAVNLWLAVALLKGKALDGIIKCAVELGAAGVIPLETRHSEVRLDASRAQSKLAHWQTVAIEAAKQSGNLAPFVIRPPQPLSEWLAEDSATACKLVASLEPRTKPIISALPADAQQIIMLIGPEGDFSSEEYQMIESRSYQPVTFGPHVLRAETACCYALGAIQAACLDHYN